MDRMDAALAKVFKQLSGKKNWLEEKKDKLDAVAKMHFKARALDMIDVWLSHQPPMGQVLYLVMPLISAMESASKQKNYEPLQERLKSTLKRLAGLKKLKNPEQQSGESSSNETSVPELMKSLVELANSGSPLVATQLAQDNLFGRLCVLVFKCGTSHESAGVTQQMWDIYFKALQDFFAKSQCQLPNYFFIQTLQGIWLPGKDASIQKKLADKLKELTFSPKLRGYKKSQGVNMMVAMIKARNQHMKTEDGGDWKELDSAILDGLASEFKTYSEATDHNKKPRYLVELLSLLGAVNSKGKDDAMKCTGLIDSLKEVKGHIPSNRKFREVKSQFNRTCVSLNISPIPANVNNKGNLPKKSPQMPNGTSEPIEASIEKGDDKANGEVDGSGGGESLNPTNNKKKKNKKSKSKEAQQKRKEQKMNEFQRQAEDEGIPSFAGLVLNRCGH